MRELDALALTSNRVNDQMQLVQKALDVIQAKDDLETEALEIAHAVIQEMHQTSTVGFSAWSSKLKKACETTCREIASTGIETFKAVEATLKTLGSFAEAVIREASDHIDAERDMAHQAKTLVISTTQNEITRLRQQNELLSKTLEAERMRTSTGKDELIQRISSLLSEFTSQREKSLTDAVHVFQDRNNKGEAAMQTLVEGHSSIMEKMENDGVLIMEALRRRGAEGKRTRDGAFKVVIIQDYWAYH